MISEEEHGKRKAGRERERGGREDNKLFIQEIFMINDRAKFNNRSVMFTIFFSF